MAKTGPSRETTEKEAVYGMWHTVLLWQSALLHQAETKSNGMIGVTRERMEAVSEPCRHSTGT